MAALTEGPTDPGLYALRHTAARSTRPAAALLRVEGADSVEVLDRLLPTELFIRYRTARQSLLLDERGRVQADLMVLSDGDDLVLLAEGLEAPALADLVRGAVRPAEAVRVHTLDDWAVLDVNGPYAWQVLSDLAGEGAQGMRFLTWFPLPQGALCLRAGLVGEFGYTFLVPAVQRAALWDRLGQLGEAVDMQEASPAAIAHARLQAWFFDVNAVPEACPLEWGLQWRVQWDKEYRGAAALRARRGATRRAVAFRADTPVPVGALVCLEGQPLGEVAVCSAQGDEVLGAALLEPFYAQAGVTAYTVGEQPIRTVSPPFVRYRSLLGSIRSARYRRGG